MAGFLLPTRQGIAEQFWGDIDTEVERRTRLAVQVMKEKLRQDKGFMGRQTSKNVRMLSQCNVHGDQQELTRLRLLDPMSHHNYGQIIPGDWRDRILCEVPTTDVNELYLQMNRWHSVYIWTEGRGSIKGLPNPDDVCIRHRAVLLNFLTVHWADARAMTSALRTDGAAYLAFYERLPIRTVVRGNEARTERRPIKNIE
jgi:hypothetical protein